MADYYVDTSVWRDLHENRKDNFRPLGEWAFEFFKKARENGEIIFFSDLVREELLRYFEEDEVIKLFNSADNNLKKLEVTKSIIDKARIWHHERKVPFGDCIHAALAESSNAILVTRDKHFYESQDFMIIKKPEELI
jgi:predicted nucleic acid-binding protein